MTPFSISRIHTSIGIFRLSGSWADTASMAQKDIPSDLAITSLEFLGTDGWVFLNLTSETSQKITSNITSVVLAHLGSQN